MNYFVVDKLEIPFDPDWKSVAISVSGGADSALLAYLICTQASHDTKINIISHIRMWQTKPWQQRDSLNVYNYLIKKFPKLKFSRHVNFIAPDLEYANLGPVLTDVYGKKVSGDNIQIRAFSEYVCFQENIDAYYNAVTQNPKEVWLGGMVERDITPTENNKHLRLTEHMGRWAIHPFRFVDKSWVINQYKNLNLNDLLEITRSCEGEVEGLDYTNYKPGQVVPTCGKCFWCKEREWAIEQSK